MVVTIVSYKLMSTNLMKFHLFLFQLLQDAVHNILSGHPHSSPLLLLEREPLDLIPHLLSDENYLCSEWHLACQQCSSHVGE